VGWWPRQEQEDLIQSTLLVFVEKFHEVRDNPSAFVVQILANRIGNELQKKRRRREIPIVDDSCDDDFEVPGVLSQSHSRELVSDESPERMASRHEVQEIVLAIDRLSPFCRTLFKGIIEGMPISEIWDSIRLVEPELSRSAYDKRIFDCRRNLRHLTNNSSQ
jgi:DNA-directed RNA polymerase specialized sigma24 family protein